MEINTHYRPTFPCVCAFFLSMNRSEEGQGCVFYDCRYCGMFCSVT